MSFRFAVVISHPIQHFAPIFRDLARLPGMDVKVFYCCDWGVEPTLDPGFGQVFAWDVPLLDGYTYEFMPIVRKPDRLSFRQIDNPDVTERLARFAPHAIWIHGYGTRTTLRSLRWAKGRSAVLFFSDSELLHRRSLPVRMAKSLLVRRILSRCDRLLSIGDNNEAYYLHYGVPQRKLIPAPFPIDLRRFRQCLTEPGRPSRGQVRARWGLPEAGVVAAFSAKMIEIKRPHDLVAALALVRGRGLPIYGLFIGDGKLRSALEAHVQQAGLSDFVKFTGFVNQREIPLVLEAADILVLPSEVEPHGQAVTESMAVGSAIVASDRVGCVGPNDAARPGQNALVYPCGDVPALADILARLTTDESQRRRMQEASWNLAETQDVSVTVRGTLRALESLIPECRGLWSALSDDWQTALQAACDGSDHQQRCAAGERLGGMA